MHFRFRFQKQIHMLYVVRLALFADNGEKVLDFYLTRIVTTQLVDSKSRVPPTRLLPVSSGCAIYMLRYLCILEFHEQVNGFIYNFRQKVLLFFGYCAIYEGKESDNNCYV